GLRFSGNRKDRVLAIGQYLSDIKLGYDIVGLQEVWLKEDFLVLRNVVRDTFPFGKHWVSGLFGSGLAIFSKYPILNTSLRRYALNGDPGHIFHGDWFDGKCCVSAIVAHPVIGDIQVFNTHLGDLNSAPDSLAIQLLTQYAGLSDSWGILHPTPQSAMQRHLSPKEGVDILGITCDTPLNSWTSHSTWPNKVTGDPIGERLDYILYKHKPEFKCKRVQVVLQEKMAGIGGPNAVLKHPSDHFAVHSVFSARLLPLSARTYTTQGPPEDNIELLEHVLVALEQHFVRSQTKSFRILGLLVPILILATLVLFSAFVWIEWRQAQLSVTLPLAAGLIIVSSSCMICIMYGFIYGRETASAFTNVIQEVQTELEYYRKID
ncbi:phospholipase C type enzyme, partial [Haplosporangium sp. Z 27]